MTFVRGTLSHGFGLRETLDTFVFRLNRIQLGLRGVNESMSLFLFSFEQRQFRPLPLKRLFHFRHSSQPCFSMRLRIGYIVPGLTSYPCSRSS